LSKRQKVDRILETTPDSDVQSAVGISKKKTTAASNAVQTRTAMKKTTVASARPPMSARTTTAATASKPPSLKGSVVEIFFGRNLCLGMFRVQP